MPLRHIPVPVQIQAGGVALNPGHIVGQLIGVQKRTVPIGLQIYGLWLILHGKLQGKPAPFAAGRRNALSGQIGRDIVTLVEIRRSKYGAIRKLRL